MAENRSLTLPEPDESEQAHSRELVDLMLDEMSAGKGYLPFERYMQMALYQPGFGYYVAGARKFGADGDFVTAPEVSPLFAQCLAQQCAEVLEKLELPASILELGAGSGMMAADLLAELERLGSLPQQYLILELSGELQQRQRQTLEQKVPHLLSKVCWLQALPDAPFSGVVVANEVLDAMPVCLFEKSDTAFQALGVACHEGELIYQPHALSDEQLSCVQALEGRVDGGWPVGYRSEWNPQLEPWLRALAERLSSAAVLLIDYGYTEADYYHPQRREGTLLSFYRHRASDQPLRYPGLQDITASVDFTAVAQAGVDAGLNLAGYTTQAYFLINNELEKRVAVAMEEDHKSQIKISQQVKQLTLPSEMGERFQVIGFTKGLDWPLRGFSRFNLTHKL